MTPQIDINVYYSVSNAIRAIHHADSNQLLAIRLKPSLNFSYETSQSRP